MALLLLLIVMLYAENANAVECQALIDAFVTFDAATFGYIVGAMLLFLALGMGVGWMAHVIRLGR